MTHDDSRIIILIAPSGAGKGTQAKFLEQKFDIVHLSTGDMLRDRAQIDDEMGNEIKKILAAGTYSSDAMMISMIKERIAYEDCQKGFILDGFPRSLNQGIALDDMMHEQQLSPTAIIEIQVDEAVLVDRIAGRYNCVECKASYHDTLVKTKVENVCDICGSDSFTRRQDDTPENLANRLRKYHETTGPLVSYYAAQNRLKQVDGNCSPQEVFGQILTFTA